MTNHYDLIIIGTGAGGGTLAHALAPTGKRILILERGSFLLQEKDNWDSRSVFNQAKYTADETWKDKEGRSFRPGIHYYVGGNTKFYGAALLRMRPADFGQVRHHGGISPGWPISYEDMEPYYTKAEHLYEVHGRHGEDPTEGSAGADYAFDAVSHEPRIQELSDDLQKCGYRPFHLPLGIRLLEKNRPQSRCIRCSTCDGFPCLVHAKSDADMICVRPAMAYPNVRLLTGALVSRLECDPSGRTVTTVHVERNGVKEEYSADIVAVSCGAINSAALLLRSANDKHPRGLANSSDMVGRHYMCHNNSAFMALSKSPNPTVFQKTLALNDFYFASRRWEFPMGHIQMLGKTDGWILKGSAPPFVPKFILDNMAHHAIDFWLTSEDLPHPDNRVVIDKQGHISLCYTVNNREGHRRLTAELKSILNKVNCHPFLFNRSVYLNQYIPIAGTAHQVGTVRFGRDPKTSALDIHCKAHDLDNLYVVDGSFFVSSSAVNPGLTIMANAMRVADHLKSRL
ncbi:MAG: GMC family oxidoreductase [Candidatus Omnitrophica bacterium]|nr:GMC family oxidoreductase [Candidatus Omnitrophota bacterium]MDE2009213.1 GMC family oxidoreductase [Candidatus Omnitrophota bacterium]MDE2213734.1 GMC family oxidoreductase [Candidatus Omnitrophota bacterium]MDE2230691.1 GMC family oxidoreductase [Candidatus Omnitrophota bacterium]